VVYPPTGTTAYEREMSNPAYAPMEYGPPLFLPLPIDLEVSPGQDKNNGTDAV